MDELKSLEVELGDLQDQVQKLSAATSASNKKISEFEKVQVECKETEKHFNQKKKKLVKAIQEVYFGSLLVDLSCRLDTRGLKILRGYQTLKVIPI